MIAPLLTLDQSRCDLAKQSFYESRELDLASRAWICERRLLFEQAWLAMFGFARHDDPSPFLIRAGESLGAHRLPHAWTAKYQVETAARPG
jgi:hypothetical protein